MVGIRSRGSQIHTVKTKYKRNKKVEVHVTNNSDEIFLNQILSQIPDYFGKYGVQLMEYGFSGEEVKNLLFESFEKNGIKGLKKVLEEHNYFIVFVDDSLPSNYSLVSDKNWCIWFWNNFDIEEYTFFVVEHPEEFKIYKHFTRSDLRMYGKTQSLEIAAYEKDKDDEGIFEKNVEDYMTSVFWSELGLKLGEDDCRQQFLDAKAEGEFSEDFSAGGFFSFEGIDFSKKIKKLAYQKIRNNTIYDSDGIEI